MGTHNMLCFTCNVHILRMNRDCFIYSHLVLRHVRPVSITHGWINWDENKLEMDQAPTQFPQAGWGSCSQGSSKRGRYRWSEERARAEWAADTTDLRDAQSSTMFLWSHVEEKIDVKDES